MSENPRQQGPNSAQFSVPTAEIPSHLEQGVHHLYFCTWPTHYQLLLSGMTWGRVEQNISCLRQWDTRPCPNGRYTRTQSLTDTPRTQWLHQTTSRHLKCPKLKSSGRHTAVLPSRATLSLGDRGLPQAASPFLWRTELQSSPLK